METTKTEKMTPTRWARAISDRHAAALKLLTVADVAAIRDGIKAEEDLRDVQSRLGRLAELRAKLDGIVNAGNAT